jgi:hypothetical protein
MIDHRLREQGSAAPAAPGNLIFKNDCNTATLSIPFRRRLQFQTILRTGFLANTAGITPITPKKEPIGIFFTASGNGQGGRGTIHRAKAATRAFFFIDHRHRIMRRPGALQKLTPAEFILGS